MMNKKGAILVMSLITFIILTIIVATFMFLLTFESRHATRDRQARKALSLTSVGTEKALQRLHTDTVYQEDIIKDGEVKIENYTDAEGNAITLRVEKVGGE